MSEDLASHESREAEEASPRAADDASPLREGEGTEESPVVVEAPKGNPEGETAPRPGGKPVPPGWREVVGGLWALGVVLGFFYAVAKAINLI